MSSQRKIKLILIILGILGINKGYGYENVWQTFMSNSTCIRFDKTIGRYPLFSIPESDMMDMIFQSSLSEFKNSQENTEKKKLNIGICAIEGISTVIGTLAWENLLAMVSWYAYNGGSHDFLPIGDVFDWPLFTIRQITITPLISASICSGIGRLFHQKGSFCNSLIGAGLGCIVGIAALGIEQNFSGDVKLLGTILFVSTPPIGALIGYNISKKKENKISKYFAQWLGVAGISHIYSSIWVSIWVLSEYSRNKYSLWYVGGNTLLASFTTWGHSKLLPHHKHGSFWKSILGAGIGSSVGLFMMNRLPVEPKSFDFEYVIRSFLAICAPSLGAVIGYNLGR